MHWFAWLLESLTAIGSLGSRRRVFRDNPVLDAVTAILSFALVASLVVGLIALVAGALPRS